jgi:hypothetical protein
MADQLRNCYRFNHWFWNRKWWWSIFLWAVGVAATNGYILYDRLYEEKRAKRQSGLPMKWNHLEFLCELIYDLMGWQSDGAQLDMDDDDVPVSNNTRSSTGTVASSVSILSGRSRWKYNLATVDGREAYLMDTPPTKITGNRMNTTFFSIRNDGRFHPSIPTNDRVSYCQFCKYKWLNNLSLQAQKRKQNAVMKNNRCNIQRCLDCNVNLCQLCINDWHGCDWNRINDSINE